MREWTTIKEYTDILFQKYGKIAKITINRPEVYNAFRPQTNREMLDAMAYCRESLEQLGIEEGDTVRMYGLSFDYYK